MLDPAKNIIGASPNSFVGFAHFTAYGALAKLGMRYVEVIASPSGLGSIAPELLDGGDVQRLKDRLAGMGLAAISVGAYCDLLYAREVSALCRRVDFARTLGAKMVVTDATRESEVSADQWRKLVNSVRYVADYAADHGLRLALETHGITSNAAGYLRLLETVDHPNVGVNYDTGNVYFYNDDVDPAEDVKQIAERVYQVHLKDTTSGKGEWKFCPLGEGQVRFPEIVDALQKVDFTGPYILELECTEDVNVEGKLQVVRKSLDYLHRIGLMPDE